MITPTQQILSNLTQEIITVDRSGRRITLRRITALDRLRLFKVIGNELSQNMAYLGLAMLATSVISIDEVPIPAPHTERQLESIVEKLGDDGLTAIAAALDDEAPVAAGTIEMGNALGTPI